MPLGTEVGLCPDDIVLDWDQLRSPKRGKERKSIYIVPFRTKVHTKRSGMDHTVLPVPAFPSWRSPDVATTATEAADRRSPLPNFWPMFIVAKRLDWRRCLLVRK